MRQFGVVVKQTRAWTPALPFISHKCREITWPLYLCRESQKKVQKSILFSLQCSIFLSFCIEKYGSLEGMDSSLPCVTWEHVMLGYLWREEWVVWWQRTTLETEGFRNTLESVCWVALAPRREIVSGANKTFPGGHFLSAKNSTGRLGLMSSWLNVTWRHHLLQNPGILKRFCPSSHPVWQLQVWPRSWLSAVPLYIVRQVKKSLNFFKFREGRKNFIILGHLL